MNVLAIVAPTFGLIAVGYAAAVSGLVSEGAQKGISEFAFSIAIPALLFRTIVISQFPAMNPLLAWGAYYGAVALTWIAALALSARLLRVTPAAGVVAATSAVYGNIAMLGIPLALTAFGPKAAGPMALILAINTPLLWLSGTLQIAWIERKDGASIWALVLRLLLDLLRNPIIIAIAAGFFWRMTGAGLNSLVDRTCEQLAQAGSPAALIALGVGLMRFELRGEALSLAVMCFLKLIIMPLVAWTLAFPVLHLPPLVGDVIVLFAAMPAGANAYLFATQYKLLANSTSAAVALGTLLSAVTLPLLITILLMNPLE
ncbi:MULTISPECIES: AEC family transporter [Bradyrhizobium]|uniref:AEC family transporter n=3 Tax=Bradyrhizobium TaxID=374 RepID=A0A410VIJ2_9BRAD|nr:MULTISPECIES: AEC family transporter [Bradyrhizobium]MCG2628135.1 AEC family transporter [Bradyrhizobium zhengyangense]MCG2643254.1 AEC family transporter [Bradyrhizobium zhengyangense]MCG2670432.1 AEC family transporter [Bradyrhizobium zhengyangense]MDN4985833.1 AEC family transporter [Bradyrhizobium sp. WYCCWR 13022]MDN5002788.1 AEC family transporter [Bradyrhizobium sp. WYCCWR 12677]